MTYRNLNLYWGTDLNCICYTALDGNMTSVQGQGCSFVLFSACYPWVHLSDGRHTCVWGVMTMPGKTLRNVGLLLNKKEARAELMLLMSICQLIGTASMLSPLLEFSHHPVVRVPKQRPCTEGSGPSTGLRYWVWHLLAE